MAVKKGFTQPAPPDPAGEDTRTMERMGKAFAEKLQDIQDRLCELGKALAERAEQLQEEENEAVKLYGEEIRGLAPFVEAAIDRAEDPEIAACRWLDVLERGLNEDGDHRNNKYGELLDWAADAREQYEAAKKELAAFSDTPRIPSRRAEKIDFPLDKVNGEVWNLISSSPSGQIVMDIPTGNDKRRDAAVLYSLDFEKLKNVIISRNLSQFDKRVYIAAAAVYIYVGSIVTIEQIYHAMGNRTKPNSEDLRKVNDSLTKMGGARLVIDNRAEAEVFKGVSHFTYDAALLPFERISAYAGGQLTKAAIHVFREPPLVSFARDRKQITTIDRALLESPLNKTEANLRLDDYLIERIGRMKSGHSPAKLLYKTVFDRCQITEKKQRQRAPEKIKKYLDHYKACGWIRGYREEPDGIAMLL